MTKTHFLMMLDTISSFCMWLPPAQTFIIYRQNLCSHKNLSQEPVLTVIWELDAGSKRQQFNFVLSISCLRQMEMPVNMETFREAACTSDKSVHFRQN